MKEHVSPRAGAWIETPNGRKALWLLSFRPVRGRGLKREGMPESQQRRQFRPVRGRGLKPRN